MEKVSKIIAVDYDGTCVTNSFPNRGKDVGAAPVLHELVANGHKLILFTCRNNHEEDRPIEMNGNFIFLTQGNHLDEAIQWFADNNIPLWGIQTNPDEHKYETAKPHYDLIIDDKALGIPLTSIIILDDEFVSDDKPFVDWEMTRYLLQNMGLL